MSRGDRLLYTTFKQGSKSYLLLLDLVLNHVYKKSFALEPAYIALAKTEQGKRVLRTLYDLNPQLKEKVEALSQKRSLFEGTHTLFKTEDASESDLPKLANVAQYRL